MMFVHESGECTRTRLDLVLRSLRYLDHRRVCQMVLVRSALVPEGVQLKTSMDPPEPGLIQDQDQEENLLQLKQQLRLLKVRDSGLVSQIRDLDRQILELRLDADWSHVPPSESPASISHSSSGFYDFSESPSLSNSLFSLSSTHHPETPPTRVFGQTRLSSSASPNPSSASPTSTSASPDPCGSSASHAALELSQTSPDFAESALSSRLLSPPADRRPEADMLKPRHKQRKKTPQSLDQDQDQDQDAGLRYKPRKATHQGRRVKSETRLESKEQRVGVCLGERKRRQRKRREEDQEDQESGSVRSRRRSSVKHRAQRSQEQTPSRPIREQRRGTGGGAKEGPGSEGGERGGARKQQLVKVKASQTLKKRIQRLKNGTFTLLTTV